MSIMWKLPHFIGNGIWEGDASFIHTPIMMYLYFLSVTQFRNTK
ncbi:hypothetical protein BCAH820_3196 [Bacillus cereus AH820]|uniref:Uncharacterized protein n=1 Tax=Bacillus cereus (strain AH820) TaxID=405535 RepID=B7JE99_BACC0|nr:hypothetical protein BCAH820_3196 [Bacillus cereus AH820]